MTKDQKIAKKNEEIRELKKAPKRALKEGALGLTRLVAAFAVPGTLGEVSIGGITGALPFAIGGVGKAVDLAIGDDSGLKWATEPMKAAALGQAGHLGVKLMGGSPQVAMERLFGA